MSLLKILLLFLSYTDFFKISIFQFQFCLSLTVTSTLLEFRLDIFPVKFNADYFAFYGLPNFCKLNIFVEDD